MKISVLKPVSFHPFYEHNILLHCNHGKHKKKCCKKYKDGKRCKDCPKKKK